MILIINWQVQNELVSPLQFIYGFHGHGIFLLKIFKMLSLQMQQSIYKYQYCKLNITKSFYGQNESQIPSLMNKITINDYQLWSPKHAIEAASWPDGLLWAIAM